LIPSFLTLKSNEQAEEHNRGTLPTPLLGSFLIFHLALISTTDEQSGALCP